MMDPSQIAPNGCKYLFVRSIQITRHRDGLIVFAPPWSRPLASGNFVRLANDGDVNRLGVFAANTLAGLG